MNPVREPKPRSFWNGWRLADVILLLALVGQYFANKATVSERIDQLRRDMDKEITITEALAGSVREHHEADSGRDAATGAVVAQHQVRLDALERDVRIIAQQGTGHR